MWASASRCASGSDAHARPARLAAIRLLRGALAAAALAAALATPATAEAYRRGLGTSLGGATLGGGHAIFLLAGYPTTTLGWAMAVHPRVDVGVYGQVAYGNPGQVGDDLVGGGGGARARFALVRGRLSLALTLDLGALAYSEAHGVAALLDLVSPALALSMRASDRLAFHVSLRAVLSYVTAPSEMSGGVEGGLGVTIGLTRAFALLISASYGTSIARPYGEGRSRLSAQVGLEYRLGHDAAPSRARARRSPR